MSASTYILATEKAWHDQLFEELKAFGVGNWIRVKNQEDFLESVEVEKPEMIFFPHWSHIIPEKMTQKYKCVIFHMTDLPYGRGGSPLQNLIVEGKKETMISALLADKGVDTGPIFLKRQLRLDGSAQEIFERSSQIIATMIKQIIKEEIIPSPQVGTPTVFKRRTPEMSDITGITEIEKVYDHIRMLDADGYPHAFIETNSFKLEFRNARLKDDQVLADVRITKK